MAKRSRKRNQGRTTAYLLEEGDGACWIAIAVYRRERDADEAWRTKTIKAILDHGKEYGVDVPIRADLQNMDDAELGRIAEDVSEGEGFFDVERIDLFE